MKRWMQSLLALTRIDPAVQHVQRQQKRRLIRSRDQCHCPARHESLALVKHASLVDEVVWTEVFWKQGRDSVIG